MKKWLFFLMIVVFCGSIYAQETTDLASSDFQDVQQENQSEDFEDEDDVENDVEDEAASKDENKKQRKKETSLLQYQTFSWRPVAKAKKYEINIEMSTDGESEWTSAFSEQTTFTDMEVLLAPGNYRVSISSYNVLGRKANTSDWIPFVILAETQPYLYNNLKVSERWNAPLLKVSPAGITHFDNPNNELFEADDTDNSSFMIRSSGEEGLKAREGDPTNSIFIKGKNIFFPNTEFFLEPKEDGDEGVSFKAFMDKRVRVPLEIIRRDTENSGVIVSYDPEVLFSGYYDLVAENPSGEEAKLEILVISDRKPQIDKSLFEYNNRYKIPLVEITTNRTNTLKVVGTGFASDTLFSFKPTTRSITYPFESIAKRHEVVLSPSSHKSINDEGLMELTFDLNPEEFNTGYYTFAAENTNSGRDAFKVLVKMNSYNNNPEIDTVKTKYSKSDQTIDFTITGQNIDENTAIVMVSPFSTENRANERIPLYFVLKKKKKLIYQANTENLETGKYALYIENSAAYATVYLQIDKNNKVAMCELTEDEAEDLFFCPPTLLTEEEVDVEETVDVNVKEEIEYTQNHYKVKQLPHVLFPYFDITLGMNPVGMNFIEPMRISTSFDVFNFNWLSLRGGVNFAFFIQDERVEQNYVSLLGEVRLAIPGKYFSPHLGVGVDYAVDLEKCMPEDYSSENALLKTSKYKAVARLGVTLLNVFDINYNLTLNNADFYIPQLRQGASPYFTDYVSIGMRLPLSGTKTKIKQIDQFAEITKPGVVNGEELTVKKGRKVVGLKFNAGTTKVGGFKGDKKLTDLVFSDTVEEILPSAFEDCVNLDTVEFSSSLVKIGANAFKNTYAVRAIKIPKTIVEIQEGAFEGWSDGQVITLDWFADDETQRNLPGLDYNDALILYKDKTPYKAKSNKKKSELDTERRLANYSDWKVFFDNNSAKCTRTHVYMKDTHGRYRKGVKMKGYIKDWGWANMQFSLFGSSYKNSLKEKNPKAIKFYVQGDGKTYQISINEKWTATFKAPKGHVAEVVIPFEDFTSPPKTGGRKKNAENILNTLNKITFTPTFASTPYHFELSVAGICFE